MTIYIAHTFITGVLFGVYLSGVLFITICNTFAKREDHMKPILLLFVSFTWPLTLPIGFTILQYAKYTKRG